MEFGNYKLNSSTRILKIWTSRSKNTQFGTFFKFLTDVRFWTLRFEFYSDMFSLYFEFFEFKPCSNDLKPGLPRRLNCGWHWTISFIILLTSLETTRYEWFSFAVVLYPQQFLCINHSLFGLILLKDLTRIREKLVR